MSLPKAERSVVTKLSAILRVADALDHAHQQRIKTFVLERTEEAYHLWVNEEAGDITLERDSLQEKGQLFIDVFGMPVYLKQGNPAAKKDAV
jgi:exopolyphosphatase/guanosine-5'-triphosphate,3'-diphosphate pyrophosphatase